MGNRDAYLARRLKADTAPPAALILAQCARRGRINSALRRQTQGGPHASQLNIVSKAPLRYSPRLKLIQATHTGVASGPWRQVSQTCSQQDEEDLQTVPLKSLTHTARPVNRAQHSTDRATTRP